MVLTVQKTTSKVQQNTTRAAVERLFTQAAYTYLGHTHTATELTAETDDTNL